MSAKLHLTVETRLEEMERLSSAIEDLGRGADWPADLSFQVNLVLEELWLNVVNHGHDDGFHEVEIELTSEAEALTIEITDDGKPFDPLNDAPEPDLKGPLNDRTVGGLGIHLVRTMMDEMRYRREGGKNHLLLVKRRGCVRGVPRLPTDVLFVLGIGGGVAFTVALSLGVWFFLGGTDPVQTGPMVNGAVERTPTPESSNTPPVEAGVSDRLVLFGQSAAFSGPAQELGRNMGRGIEAAFHEVNEAGGVHGRRLDLVSLDDAYEPEAAIANTLELIEQESIFALIGAVGTPTSRSAVPVAEAFGVPYIAPFTGAAFLRDAKWETVINLRASYNQETEEMVARLTEDLGIERIGIMYQDDSYGRAGYRGVISALERREMEPAAIGLYTRNTLAVKTALLDLSRGAPEAVILVGAYQPVAELIEWGRYTGLDSVYMTISFVGSNALAIELGPDGAGVYVTQVVPFPADDSIPIVASYLKALSAYAPDAVPGFVSLEGYLAGRLAIAGLQICGREVDRACFLDSLRSTSITDLDGFHLRYGYDDSQGSDAVFLTVIGSDGRYHSIDSLQDATR